MSNDPYFVKMPAFGLAVGGVSQCNHGRDFLSEQARCCFCCEMFSLCVSNGHGFRCGLHDKYVVEFMGSDSVYFSDKGTSLDAARASIFISVSCCKDA